MKKLCDGAYYLQGDINVGVIAFDVAGTSHLYLVDSGAEPESGDALWNELENFFGGGFVVDAIINTHGHSDHVGLNHYVQQKTGCRIYISRTESVIVRNLSASIERIWGANCIHQLKKWYTLRESFSPTDICAAGDSISLEGGAKIDLIPLYGHSAEQLGIVYTSAAGKKVVFAGDAFLGIDELDKCKISFQESPLEAMETMEMLLDFGADYFVQSHGTVAKDAQQAKTIVKKNLDTLKKLSDLALELIAKKKRTVEEIVSKAMKRFKIPQRPVSYALIFSTTKSLLSELYEAGRIGINLKKGRFYWTKKLAVKK